MMQSFALFKLKLILSLVKLTMLHPTNGGQSLITSHKKEESFFQNPEHFYCEGRLVGFLEIALMHDVIYKQFLVPTVLIYNSLIQFLIFVWSLRRYIAVQIEPRGRLPKPIEHFGEPVVCCQICNLANFNITLIPRFQKISLKSGNSASICVIESFCKGNCFFFGLISKLGYF